MKNSQFDIDIWLDKNEIKMSDFYVHLQSDGSYNYFPENKIQDFKNYLSKPIEINEDEFEVAVVQCSYVYNPPYIKKGTKAFTIGIGGEVTNVKFDRILTNKAGYNVDWTSLKEWYRVVESTEPPFLILHDHLAEFFKARSIPQYPLDEFDNLKIPDDLRNKKLVLLKVQSVDFFTKHNNISENDYQQQKDEIKAALKSVLQEDKVKKCILNITDKSYKEFLESRAEKDTPIISISLLAQQMTINSLQAITTYLNTKDLEKEEIETNSCSLLRWNSAIINGYTPFYLLRFRDLYDLTNSITYSVKKYTFCLKNDVSDLQGLVDELNSLCPDVKFEIKNNYINLIFKNASKYDHFSIHPFLEAMLGLTEPALYIKTDGIMLLPKFRPHFNFGQQKMYIYSNCVKNQFVGDVEAPLMRVAEYEGTPAKVTHVEFQHNHYLPLKSGYIDYVHIYIKSEIGVPLPIEIGTFTVTLHFRKRRD